MSTTFRRNVERQSRAPDVGLAQRHHGVVKSDEKHHQKLALLFKCNVKLSSNSEVLQVQAVRRYSSAVDASLASLRPCFPACQFSASTASLYLLTKRLKDAGRRLSVG